jgi:Uma2 family endonuclease
MVQAARSYTIESLERIPRDGKRYEILDGALIVTPAPPPAHEIVRLLLGEILLPYVRRHGLGQVLFGPSDVIFDEHSLLEPDLLVILGEKASRFRTWREMPDPALAIEILSPSSARYDRGTKRERYLTKVAEYWIVDIEGCLIELWRTGDERPAIHRATLEWRPVASAPPLVVDVASLHLRGSAQTGAAVTRRGTA